MNEFLQTVQPANQQNAIGKRCSINSKKRGKGWSKKRSRQGAGKEQGREQWKEQGGRMGDLCGGLATQKWTK